MITREDCIKIGVVTKAHSLQGEVIVTSENDFLEKYADEPVFIQLDGGPVPFFIEDEGFSVRNHTSYIVKFLYVDTKEQAERLTGCDVMIEKGLLDDEDVQSFDYDIFELEGFSVTDENSGETGKVVDVADYSGNVVLSIEIFGKEILLPVSEIYIKEVNFEDSSLLVNIPVEIIELN